jgi:hypothetical protein
METEASRGIAQTFEEDTGAPAKSMEEMTAWASSARGRFVIETKAKILQKKDHTRN